MNRHAWYRERRVRERVSQGNDVVHDRPVTHLADQLGLDQFIAQIEWPPTTRG